MSLTSKNNYHACLRFFQIVHMHRKKKLSTFCTCRRRSKNSMPDSNQINGWFSGLTMAVKWFKIAPKSSKAWYKKWLIQSQLLQICTRNLLYLRSVFVLCEHGQMYLNFKWVLHCDNRLFEHENELWPNDENGNRLTNFAMGHGKFNETCSQF